MTDPNQRLGRSMIYASWLLVLGLLTWFFSSLLDKQYNPNQNLPTQTNQGQKVILQRNDNGHYIATGTINNKSVTFLLDTGATLVSIPGHLTRHLDLEQGIAVGMNTANGTITTYSTKLNRVQLGPIELQSIRAIINPHTQANEVLLGMSFLKHLEFTQQGDTLILRQHP